LDTHKARIAVAVAVAEPGRAGEVRFRGEIANRPEAVRRLLERLAERHGELRVCHEAGPCGYGLYRQVTALGHDCAVVAPSLVPRRPGERVKTATYVDGPEQSIGQSRKMRGRSHDDREQLKLLVVQRSAVSARPRIVRRLFAPTTIASHGMPRRHGIYSPADGQYRPLRIGPADRRDGG
jgi:transposase